MRDPQTPAPHAWLDKATSDTCKNTANLIGRRQPRAILSSQRKTMVQLQTDANSEARTCELTNEAVTLETANSETERAPIATTATQCKNQRTLSEPTQCDNKYEAETLETGNTETEMAGNKTLWSTPTSMSAGGSRLRRQHERRN